MLVGFTQKQLESGIKANLTEAGEALSGAVAQLAPYAANGATIKVTPEVVTLVQQYLLVVSQSLSALADGRIVDLEGVGETVLIILKQIDTAGGTGITVE